MGDILFTQFNKNNTNKQSRQRWVSESELLADFFLTHFCIHALVIFLSAFQRGNIKNRNTRRGFIFLQHCSRARKKKKKAKLL